MSDMIDDAAAGARREAGGRAAPRPRPGLLRWLWYALGGRLPDRYRVWVLHDVSTRSWALRHLCRTAVQLSPIAVLLFLFLPGSVWVRVGGVVGGMLLGFIYSIAYMNESCEHRAVKAGYPSGSAAAAREAAHATERAASAQRYAEQWRRSAEP
ncbi:DUF5313 family protein [Pseudonocardia hispaniensis]|uniref:DUF5313 family protein n=1 Tax=Pseudonocardia hispaniensis TaxID=904933 RepID=A0ABW1J7I8_9PSEU